MRERVWGMGYGVWERHAVAHPTPVRSTTAQSQFT